VSFRRANPRYHQADSTIRAADVKDIFLVEDEAFIRMMIADMIEELGHRVVAEAGNLPDAARLATTTQFDLAILDININGDEIFPVAKIIAGRNVPFVFASGYGARGLPEPFLDRTVLQKPFLVEQLRQAIETVVA
jgi:CheY-like chemotaxis protein